MAREIINQEPFAPHVAGLNIFIRDTAVTLFHRVGTCGLGASEMSITDPASLHIQGTSRLRVVEASIAPVMSRSNSVATTSAVPEKVTHHSMGNEPCGGCDQGSEKYRPV